MPSCFSILQGIFLGTLCWTSLYFHPFLKWEHKELQRPAAGAAHGEVEHLGGAHSGFSLYVALGDLFLGV